MMIQTFKHKKVALLFQGQCPKGVAKDVAKRAHKKLLILDAAETLEDLRSPPGNNLEMLSGERSGQHSIRINKKWRLCFIWKNDDIYDVEFCDYH